MYNEKIRIIREAKGYSQEEIADMLGIAQNTYSKIERNKTQLSVRMLQNIAGALGVPPGELLLAEKPIIAINATNIQPVGMNQVPDEIHAYKIALEQAQKEIDYLKEHNAELLQLLKSNNEQLIEALLWV